MKAKPSLTVLRDNLNGLVDAWKRPGEKRSVRGWAIAHKMEPTKAQRAVSKTSPRTETLDYVAEALGVDVWELLVEGFDPNNRKMIVPKLSPEALQLALTFDAHSALTEPAATRGMVHATALQIAARNPLAMAALAVGQQPQTVKVVSAEATHKLAKGR